MAIQNLIRAAMFTPPGSEPHWGRPLIVWGPPGVGKTHLFNQLAKRYALPTERLSPGERGEGQFGVVPVPGADGFLHYPAPAWAQRLSECGLLFVDEINTAPPALQAPLLGLVQFRTLGSYTFAPRVRVVGAANETSDAAGGWDLAPALANRFGHLDYEGLDTADWTVLLLSGFGAGAEITPMDPAAEERRVLEAWPGAIASARGLVASFIIRRPDLLHKPPTRKTGVPSRAWPSRRSVEYAVEMLAAAQVHGLTPSETDELMAAFVGNPWVGEFSTWRGNADLPDPGDLLDGKVKWQHDERRVDRTLAVLMSCSSLVTPVMAARRKDRALACWLLVGEVLSAAADVAIPAAKALVMAGLVPTDPRAKAALHKVAPLLQTAGVGG